MGHPTHVARLARLRRRPAPGRGHPVAYQVGVAAVAALFVAALNPLPAGATFPFTRGPGDPYDYTRLHIDNGACSPLAPGQPRPAGSDLPSNFDCRNDWKLTDYAAQPGDGDYDPAVATNPQELHGVKGSSTNLAWEVTTGRPDVVIAVMDSGIRWDEDRTNLVNKFFLSRGELPVPGGSAKGGPLTDYDVNGDGVFNVKDYAGDPRAVDSPLDENTLLDPGDLIRAFSDSVDDDGNGYVDDISGWDFFENDNDANDDVDYGHGTGESEDSAGETETNLDPQCPNCMLLEMRVGDSFVADINHWAEAVVYATDNGASVVQEALGTLNHTAFGQAAADYAYDRGVVIIASQADESAGHHNYPAALNHTMLVNSVTKFVNLGSAPGTGTAGGPQFPHTYLAFNGCTNFGGYSWVTVPSTSCSSDATAQAAGMAGLVYAAGRNAVDNGVIEPDSSGHPLSAEEVKQLFRVAADDVDFSTPKPPGPPNNFATTLPASQRFVTTAGWDQITGWGRTNANAMVRLVADGRIPPEADITSPRWWQPLDAAGSVKVVGRADAPRAHSFTWEVQWAPGVQPPRWPSADTWHTAGTGTSSSPVEGELATIDLAQVKAALATAPPPYTPADDPTSRDLPEKDAFRVRVVVKDDRADTPDAIEQRQYFAVSDPTLLAGFPRFLEADGAGSPAFEDIDGDGTDELVIGDGNGFVHAFKANGSEAAGWPVHTNPLPLPTSGDNAYTDGALPGTVYAPVLLGSPAIGDLDGDGRPEVAVGDIEGNLFVWHADGTLADGFPVRGNPDFSEEPGCEEPGASRPACDDQGPRDVRDSINTVDHAFTANPSIGDLDPTPGLEIVAGSNDGHVYAWHADGDPVTGWPVLLRDPTKVAAVDPVTHRITFTPAANVRFGRKVLTTPTLGDLDGDGDLEVVVNVNEEYKEPPNWSMAREITREALGAVVDTGNTRVYALHHDGTAHPPTAAQAASPHPDDQAYVAGWPARIGMLTLQLLPYVGEGSNGAPVVADVDGNGSMEVGTASIAGPAYLLRADGTSFFGNDPQGRYITMSTLPDPALTAATDYPSIASLGGGVFGRLTGPAGGPSFAMGSTGLRRLLDVVLPEQQLGAEDHISAWNTTTGNFEPGFPAQMNDLMFFNTPAVMDIDGDGLPEVLQSSAMYDLRAYKAGGVPALGWPKFTGGWSVSTPGGGDLDGDGKLDVALMTREGNLFVWKTKGKACQTPEWSGYQHDLHNTGAYRTDARAPGVIKGLSAQRAGSTVTLSWTASGDDGPCGTAHHYEVRVDGVAVTGAPTPATGGTAQTMTLPVGPGAHSVEVWAVDEVGQRGRSATASVASAPNLVSLRAPLR